VVTIPSRLLVLLLAGGAVTCFTGDRLLGQPCADDRDCNPPLDLLGERLRCDEGLCASSTCGNGVRDADEECDDANLDDDDGCLSTCHAYLCGDGLVSPRAEGCDDANLDDDDGCTNACQKVAVAIGSGPTAGHFCALSEGNVRCWGRNGEGQLGRGSTANLGDEPGELPPEDIPLPGDQPIVQIVAGTSTTCARFGDGAVRCWGLGIYGIAGLGEPTAITLGDDLDLLAELPPVVLGGPALEITAGGDHACALLVGGAVRCWGHNELGQAGHGDQYYDIGVQETPASLGPLPLPGPALQVVAGQIHTCALLEGGAVHCWGYSPEGALGVPGVEYQLPPGQPVELGASALQIAAGSQHNCALLEDGAVRCWGRGRDGALGSNDDQDLGDDESPAAASPVVVLAPGDRVLRLVAGANHTCALLEGGAVRCWGLAWSGELGYGDYDNRGDDPGDLLPPLIDLGGEVVDLALGDAATCALLRGGAVRCWGRGSEGQLGTGGTLWIGDQPGEMPPPDAQIYSTPPRFLAPL
jgi:cysteine-rich repeat protein